MALLVIVIIIITVIIFGLIVWAIVATGNGSITGNKCQSNADCTTGTVCDTTTATCLVPLGGVCSDKNTCVSGAQCINGRCVANSQLSYSSKGRLNTSPLPSLSPKTKEFIEISVPVDTTYTFSEMTESVSFVSEPLSSQSVEYIEDETELKSPYTQVDNKMLSKPNMNQGEVVDVAHYSSCLIYLLDSGDIIKQDDRRHKFRIFNNVHLTRLEVFSGYLHGVSDGRLYRFDNNDFDKSSWRWYMCDWAIDSIVHTSVTTDLNYLWLQSSTRGYVYDRRFKPVLDQIDADITPGIKRNYGANLRQYLNYDFAGCKITVHDQGRIYSYDDVAMGTYDSYGKIVVINRADMTKYTDIRIINRLPYYIG